MLESEGVNSCSKEVFSRFVGIDISKAHFDVALHGKMETTRFPNTVSGWSDLIHLIHLSELSELKTENTLVVIEPTGGYEKGVLWTLLQKRVSVHRADTRKVKSFIRSYGVYGKTDQIDAIQLARYGYERHSSLTLFSAYSSELDLLKALVARYNDLKEIQVKEKNRIQHPHISSLIRKSINAVLKVTQKQLEMVEIELDELINGHQELKTKQTVMQAVPGIGKKVSQQLLACLPELGYLNRKQIACLSGVAPHPKESGTLSKYRKTGYGGKQNVKAILHMAALAAAHSKSDLGLFYASLIARGKKPLVAITALKRKIIVIANAKIRDSLLLHYKPTLGLLPRSGQKIGSAEMTVL